MSLSEILAREQLYGHNPKHKIVKCIKYATAWPDAGGLTVGEIYDAYFCKEQGTKWVVIDGLQYYADRDGDIDFITTDFPQLEKLMFIGRKKHA